MKSIGIILAAGKGTRFGIPGINKTAALFNNKPLIWYGIELYKGLTDKTVIVIGAHAESVRNVAGLNDQIIFASQKKRLGTGHALHIAVKAIQSEKHDPEFVLVGCGDHMMYYKKELIQEFTKLHSQNNAAISFITTTHNDPMSIAWGRVIRDESGSVTKIVEQKDANEEELKTTELNSGFYCIDYKFLKKYHNKLTKSPVTGEYYLPQLVEIAMQNELTIMGYPVPFNYVGLGINTHKQLSESQQFYSTIKEDPKYL